MHEERMSRRKPPYYRCIIRTTSVASCRKIKSNLNFSPRRSRRSVARLGENTHAHPKSSCVTRALASQSRASADGMRRTDARLKSPTCSTHIRMVVTRRVRVMDPNAQAIKVPATCPSELDSALPGRFDAYLDAQRKKRKRERERERTCL